MVSQLSSCLRAIAMFHIQILSIGNQHILLDRGGVVTEPILVFQVAMAWSLEPALVSLIAAALSLELKLSALDTQENHRVFGINVPQLSLTT